MTQLRIRPEEDTNMQSQIVGTLKQGYKTMANYQWQFPLTRHLLTHDTRLSAMH